jgi:hypothetical protein
MYQAISPGGSEILINLSFYILVSSLVYCLGSNIQGREPNQIPVISEAANRALGPM